jgi:hypothetical protein
VGHEFRISRIGRFGQGLVVLVIGSQLAGVEGNTLNIALAV